MCSFVGFRVSHKKKKVSCDVFNIKKKKKAPKKSTKVETKKRRIIETRFVRVLKSQRQQSLSLSLFLFSTFLSSFEEKERA